MLDSVTGLGWWGRDPGSAFGNSPLLWGSVGSNFTSQALSSLNPNLATAAWEVFQDLCSSITSTAYYFLNLPPVTQFPQSVFLTI